MAQAKIAEELGYDSEHIKILSSGDVLEIDENGAEITGKVPVGNIMVDGLGVGDVGNIVLRDRQKLAEDGIIIVVMTLESGSGQVLAGPDIVSRGFVYVKESDELIEEARLTVDEALQKCLDRGITAPALLRFYTGHDQLFCFAVHAEHIRKVFGKGTCNCIIVIDPRLYHAEIGVNLINQFPESFLYSFPDFGADHYRKRASKYIQLSFPKTF